MLRDGLDFEKLLAELARGNVVAEGNLQDVLCFLSRKAAEALGVRRVSIWLFDEAHIKLNCFLAFDAVENNFCYGEELVTADYPSYFRALEQMRTIAAIDVETDPRTREMRDTYLRQHHITTMLDAPVYLQGEVVGVVCHEHSESHRAWSESEKSFAALIADSVSIALEANRLLEAERRLSETEELLRTVTEQMRDAFCLLEPEPETGNFIVRYANPSGAAMTGYTVAEILGKPSDIFRAPESKIELSEMIERARNGETVIFENLMRRKDDSIFPVEVSLEIVRHQRKQMIAIIARDISERLTAEKERMAAQAQTLQDQRLESLGMLAGNIAHDFNNLLVSILGNVNLAIRNLSAGDKIKRNLEKIEATAQIAADLCNQLLIYSGKQHFDLTEVNLNQLVAEMSRLLEVSLPSNVTLRMRSEEILPTILAEPTQVRQILLNLVTNAADAMAEKGGYIRIQTYTEHFTESDLARKNFDIQAVDFADKVKDRTAVCLRVEDNGKGMNEDIRQYIFEPFFTTKAKGRGLGMAAIGGIIRAHSGAIKVESKPNEGTIVCVWFPAQTH